MTCTDLHGDTCFKCLQHIDYWTGKGIGMRKYRKRTLDCGHRITTNVIHRDCMGGK